MIRLVVFFIFITSMVCAQDAPQEALISGTILDEKKNAVPYGNVSIHNPSDSTLITGGVPDDQGKFSVPIKPISYCIMVSFLSYEERIIPNIMVAGENVDLGIVVLKENSQVLNELVVRGQKDQMELQLDKRVFNIQK